MATKDQYEFFRSLYEEEERTYEQLEGRAKVYLGVISAFLAAMVLKTDDLVAGAKDLHVAWWAVLLEALLLTVALIVILHALRIRAYEVPNFGDRILAGYEGDGPTDEEFYEDRIVDYSAAQASNLKENNETAYFLHIAGWLIVVGMVGLMLIFVVALWRSQNGYREEVPGHEGIQGRCLGRDEGHHVHGESHQGQAGQTQATTSEEEVTFAGLCGRR